MILLIAKNPIPCVDNCVDSAWKVKETLGMEQISNKIDVLTYTDVCAFLQDFYTFKKSINSKFSYTSWAAELGEVDRSYLRLVCLGKRPVNENLQRSMIQYFNFDEQGSSYFALLAGSGRARNPQEKGLWAQRIMAFRGVNPEIIEAREQYDFLSDPILPALHTVLGFNDVQTDKKILAEVFSLTEEEMASKIQKLKELKLLNDLEKTNRSWKVANSFGSLAHREFYEQTFQQATTAMSLPVALRRFRSLFVAMSENEFSDFLKDFELFAKEQLAKRNVSSLAHRRLFHLNFNFFSVTEELPETTTP